MSENKNPVYRGQVQTDDQVPIGSIALWKNESENPKAPVLRGTITKEDGTKFTVSLWNFTPKKTDKQATL